MAVNQQQVAAALQRAGVSVFNLQVEDAGGVTTLRGDVASQADLDKVQQVLQGLDETAVNYLNVQGGGGLANNDAGNATAGAQQYTIRGGDTLRKIAQHFYGDEMQWKRIYEANRDKIPNPDVIHAGASLVIPAK